MTRAVWLNVSLDVVPFPTFVINGHKDVCSDSQGAVTGAYQHRFLPPHQLQKKSITAGTTGIPTLMFWKLSQKLTGFRTTWTLQVWLSIWKKYPVFVCCCCFFNLVPSGSLCNLNYDPNAWLCQTHFGFPTNTTPQAPHPETPIKPVWPGCIMNGVIFFQLFWQGLCKVFSFTFISDIGQ